MPTICRSRAKERCGAALSIGAGCLASSIDRDVDGFALQLFQLQQTNEVRLGDDDLGRSQWPVNGYYLN